MISFHEEFQTEILQCIMQDDTFLPKIKHLFEDVYFSFRTCKEIYKKIKQYSEYYDGLPTKKSLLQDFESNPTDNYEANKQIYYDVITEIYENKLTADQIKKVNAEVLAYLKFVKFKDAFSTGYDDLNNQDYEKIVNRFQSILDMTSDLDDIGTVITIDLEERLARRKKEFDDNFVEKSIPTGYPLFDQKTRHGGVPFNTVSAVVAGTGVGKSIFLCNIGNVASKLGYIVFHYTLETSKEEIEDRYDALTSNQDINKLVYKEDEIKIAWEEHSGGILVKHYPSKTITISGIEAHLRRIEKEYGIKPDMVIIDYFDEMILNRGPFTETRAIRKNHMSFLRSFAEKHNIVLWTALQGNTQSVNKKTVDKDDIDEGSYVIHPADLVMSISETKKEKQIGKCRLWVVKCRYAEDQYAIDCIKSTKTMSITQIASEYEIEEYDDEDTEE